jgi:hypothetical protein
MLGRDKEDDGDREAVWRRRGAAAFFIMRTIDNLCSGGLNEAWMNPL